MKSGDIDDVISVCIVTKSQQAVCYSFVSVPRLVGRSTHTAAVDTLRAEHFTT